jgi:hypothetical protein
VLAATLEPLPASLLELNESGSEAAGAGAERGKGPGSAELASFCPLLRAAPAVRQVVEMLPDFGTVRTLVLESYCRTEDGSLGARLLDAMDIVQSLLGEPEQVEASHVPALHAAAPGAARSSPGESLRTLHGTLTANLRFADGRAASLVLTDQGGRWERRLTLLAAPWGGADAPVRGGRLRASDEGVEWISAAGELVDGGVPEVPAHDRDAAGPIAAQLRAMLERRSAPLVPVSYAAVLAMAGAALLSARTGEGESPETILKIARGT